MYPMFLGLVRITTANQRIVFDEGGSDLNADITPGDYYVRGDGTSSDLLKAIKTALDAAGADAYTVAVGDRDVDASAKSMQIVVATDDVTNFGLFKSGGTFDEGLIGFSGAQSGDTAYTSTLSPSAVWLANEPYRELEPLASQMVSVRTSLTGRVRGLARSDKMRRWRLGFGSLREERTLEPRNTTDPTATLERFLYSYGAGAAFELHDLDINTGTTVEATTSSTRVGVMHFAQETLERFEPRRIAPGTPLYAVDLALLAQVTS